MAFTQKKLGLSLSGGGYRAAAFHLGTLKKLHEMKLLESVDVISTISGGSIIGAYYCLHKGDFNRFEKEAYKRLQNDNIINRVVFSATSLGLLAMVLLLVFPAFYFLFTGKPWLFLGLLTLFVVLLLKFQFYIFPVSKGIEKAYDAFFYNNKTLSDLPDSPEIVIGSTNIQTARPFSFSKYYMGDSDYDYRPEPVTFHPSAFPLSRAVMASSCVPFAFTPISISQVFFTDPWQAAKVHPLLVDGGVYDNQGIHKLTQKGRFACTHIITSDAGGGSKGELSFHNAISLLISTVNVFMARIKNAQMVEDIYENTATANRQIAYLSLAWDIENCIPGFIRNLGQGHITASVIAALELRSEWVLHPKVHAAEITAWLEERTGYRKILAAAPTPAERTIARNTGTNLTSLKKKNVDCLIKQAACLTELQVKLYCPSLLKQAL